MSKDSPQEKPVEDYSVLADVHTKRAVIKEITHKWKTDVVGCLSKGIPVDWLLEAMTIVKNVIEDWKKKTETKK